MQPLRFLFSFLVITTTLLVLIGLLFSKKRNPARNPFVLIIMSFLTTMILWLAWLGLIHVFGSRSVGISPQLLTILFLLAGSILMPTVNPKHAENRLSSLIRFLGLAWALMIAILAVVGLSSITDTYARTHAVTWAIASLSLCFSVQAVRALQEHGVRGNNNDEGNDAGREGYSGREDSV